MRLDRSRKKAIIKNPIVRRPNPITAVLMDWSPKPWFSSTASPVSADINDYNDS